MFKCALSFVCGHGDTGHGRLPVSIKHAPLKALPEAMGSLHASSNTSHSSAASSAPPRFPASTTVSPRFGVRRCCAFVGVHRRHHAWVHRNEALDQNKPTVTQTRVAGGTDLACCRRQASMQHRVVPSPETTRSQSHSTACMSEKHLPQTNGSPVTHLGHHRVSGRGHC